MIRNNRPETNVKRIGGRRAAISLIKKLHATIVFDEKQPGRPIIGVHLHHHFYKDLTDANLAQLEALPHLQNLFGNCEQTESSVALRSTVRRAVADRPVVSPAIDSPTDGT